MKIFKKPGIWTREVDHSKIKIPGWSQFSRKRKINQIFNLGLDIYHHSQIFKTSTSSTPRMKFIIPVGQIDKTEAEKYIQKIIK
jgi:hypothetical protein